jgi:hypothetical protein
MTSAVCLIAATCVAASAARAQTTLVTPTDLHVTDFSGTTVFLEWTDNNSPSQAHRVYRRISGGTFVAVFVTPFAGGGYPPNFADGIVTAPLTQGVTYEYYVVAFDPVSPADESGQSNHVTITTGTPYLNVTYPNGSETLTAVTMETITWNTNWPDLNVEIHASIDGGFNWSHEVRDGTTPLAAAGSFDWKVGYDSTDTPFVTVDTDTCVIRVTGVGTSLQDQSDAVFTIVTVTVGPAYLDVTSPVGTDALTTGATHTITWNTNWPDLNVQILASTDGGTNWDHEVRDGLTPLTAAGEFDWKVGYDGAGDRFITQETDTCVVRVLGVEAALQGDSETFTIFPDPGSGGENDPICGAGGRPFPLAFSLVLCTLWLSHRRAIAVARAGT